MVSIGRNMSLINGALKTSRRKRKDLKNSGVKDIALNCPGCYLGLKGTNYFKLPWKKIRKMHYMPDELLEAFGDKLETPLAKKMQGVCKPVLRVKRECGCGIWGARDVIRNTNYAGACWSNSGLVNPFSSVTSFIRWSDCRYARRLSLVVSKDVINSPVSPHS